MAKLSDYLKNIFFIIILLQVAPPILQSLKKQYIDALEPKSRVGYITLSGVMGDSAYATKWLKKFFKEPSIKAILLRIESAGSAAGTAEAIANEIEILKKEYPKPIMTLSENICTSGAYMIAAATDHILAPPSALIGSIGTTIANQFKVKDLLEYYKIHYESIKTGDYKDSTNPFVNPTPEQLAHLEGITKDSYQYFTEYVAKNRKKLSLANVKEWANGKLFTARQAQKLGLIDEIGSLSNAVDYLKKTAMLEEKIEWIKPARSAKGLLSYLTGDWDSTDEFTAGPLEGHAQYLAALFLGHHPFSLHNNKKDALDQPAAVA